MRFPPALALLARVGLLLATAGAARANGGPVVYSAGLSGGIEPLVASGVRLVTEDLTIKVRSHPSFNLVPIHEVEARYLLSNPAGEMEILYGVPLPERGAKSGGRVRGLGRRGPLRPVQIQVGGKEYSCESAQAAPPGSPSLGSEQLAHWCVARIRIPRGDAIPLVLRYSDYLSFGDTFVSHCPFSDLGDRQLRYLLAPAGYWDGPVERLDIRLDLGEFTGTEVVKGPGGFRKEGAALLWSFRGIDLKSLGPLEVTLDGAMLLARDKLAGFSRFGRTEVRASSGTPAQAVDADLRTAWCPTGRGAGDWMEVTLRYRSGVEERAPVGLSLRGFIFAPGQPAGSAPYVTKLRLSPCGRESGRGPNRPQVLVSLPKPAADPLHRLLLLHEPELMGCAEVLDSCKGTEIPLDPIASWVEKRLKNGQSACVRVEIAGISAPGDAPACVAEFVPVITED